MSIHLVDQAAKAGWAAPLLALICGFFFGNAVVALILIPIGLLCCLFAFYGAVLYGPSGILLPAIIGLVLNSAYLAMFVASFLAARKAAEAAGLM